MSSWWRRLLGQPALPPGFAGRLESTERALAVATLSDGDHIVLTELGIWVPEGQVVRRIGWQWVTKAVWDRSALVLTEAVSEEEAGEAVLLADLPPRRFVLAEPRKVPEVVRERVNGSIRSSQYQTLPGGGAWFAQRKVPGRDGVVLQVRPDPDTDRQAVRRVAAEVAERMRRLRSQG